MKGRIKIVEHLISLGADSTVYSSEGGWVYLSPLAVAAREGHRDIVECLLRNGANPDDLPNKKADFSPRGNPLSRACDNKHYRVAKILLEYGANPHPKVSSGHDPLYISLLKGRAKTVNLLLEYGADLSKKHTNLPLLVHDAANNGHYCFGSSDCCE